MVGIFFYYHCERNYFHRNLLLDHKKWTVANHPLLKAVISWNHCFTKKRRSIASLIHQCFATLLFILKKCRRWDLNPHGLNDHRHLKPARLPIPPLLHVSWSLSQPRINYTDLYGYCQQLFYFSHILSSNNLAVYSSGSCTVRLPRLRFHANASCA